MQGVRVPLDSHTKLPNLLTLADLRAQEAAVMAVRSQLQAAHGDPLEVLCERGRTHVWRPEQEGRLCSFVT